MSEVREGEPKRVEGYVIMAGEDSYLGIFDMVGLRNPKTDPMASLTWDSKNDITEARVFDKNFVAQMVESVKNDPWQTKPTHAIPAIWSEDKGVVITGKKITFDQIPPLQEN